MVSWGPTAVAAAGVRVPECALRGPKPPPVRVSAAERAARQPVVRRPITRQQLAVRARLVLAAAAGRTHRRIARALGVRIDTARRWRGRRRALQAVARADRSVAERLADAPRSGRPVRITAAQVCQIVEPACAAPQRTGRPISQWTGRAITDAVMRRGSVDRLVDRLSGRHATRRFQRGAASRTAGAPG